MSEPISVLAASLSALADSGVLREVFDRQASFLKRLRARAVERQAALEEAQSPDRLAADIEMFALLREVNFEGPGWDALAARLTRHGLAVLTAWLCSGQIFARAMDKGMPLYPTNAELAELQASPEARADLIHMPVAVALANFRKRAREGTGWDPGGGASLATYFVTGCIYAFANEFTKRRKEQQNWSAAATVRPDDPDIGWDLIDRADNTADPAEHTADTDTIRRALETMDPRDRRIVWGKARGDSNEQIAAAEGLTPKATERRWSRLMDRYEWLRHLSRGRKPR